MQQIKRSIFYKLPRFTFSAVLLTLALNAAPARSAVTQIDCPLPEMRREITTPLPGGWWNTPQVNRLRETRLATIGGRNALICDYGPSGTIQRYVPDGANCTTQSSGFRCQTAGVAATNPGTFTARALDIPQTFTADLDQGVVRQAGADIWFQAETRDLLYIAPRNGARLGVGNRRNRNYAGCAAARFTRDRVSLRDIPVGSYVCVKTNEGRISQFRVNALSAGSPKTLSIGYTTWNN